MFRTYELVENPYFNHQYKILARRLYYRSRTNHIRFKKRFYSINDWITIYAVGDVPSTL